MNPRRTKWLILGYIRRHRVILSGLTTFLLLALLIGRYFGLPIESLLAESFTHTRFVEGLIGPVNSINPLFVSSDSEKDLSRLVFRGLTQTDVSGVTQGDLAASWDVDPSGKEYIFHLKPNQKFQTGQTVTADDVAYTYQLAKDRKYGSSLALTFKDLEVQALDGTTVLFHLHDSFSPLLSLTDLGILPQDQIKHQLDRGVDLAKVNLNGLGSTDFKLVSLSSDSITLVRDQAKYSFRIYRSESDLRTALKLGEIETAAFTENPNLVGWGNFHVLSSSMYRRFVGVFYNERGGVTADRSVRQALSLAIDKDKLLNQTNGTVGERAYSPIPPTSWAKSESPRRYDYDPAAAKANLEKSGWDGGPIRSRGSQTLEVSLSYPDSPQYQAIANQVAVDWGNIGVRALLNPLDVTTFQTKVIGAKSFQAAIFTEEIGSDPDQYVLWHSTQKDAANITGVSLPKLDKTLEDGRKTVSQSERISKYLDFQRFFLDEAPVTMLYYPKLVYVISNKVYGVSLPPLGVPSDRFSNILDWKIKKTIF
jgi:peptide/nickel transport system substrate-binding protein